MFQNNKWQSVCEQSEPKRLSDRLWSLSRRWGNWPVSFVQKVFHSKAELGNQMISKIIRMQKVTFAAHSPRLRNRQACKSIIALFGIRSLQWTKLTPSLLRPHDWFWKFDPVGIRRGRVVEIRSAITVLQRAGGRINCAAFHSLAPKAVMQFQGQRAQVNLKRCRTCCVLNNCSLSWRTVGFYYAHDKPTTFYFIGLGQRTCLSLLFLFNFLSFLFLLHNWFHSNECKSDSFHTISKLPAWKFTNGQQLLRPKRVISYVLLPNQVTYRCETNDFTSNQTTNVIPSISVLPSLWRRPEVGLNSEAPEWFEGFLRRYRVLGTEPVHFLRRRWVHSLTVLNYAEGRRLCKDYAMIQRRIRLWSKVIEFGSWYPSQWRMEAGDLICSFFSWCDPKYIQHWRDCVHIKSLPSQRPPRVGL